MSSPQSKARVIGLQRPLKDVTVTAGETATFECELSYEDIPVEWFLEGKKLEPSDRVSPNTPDQVFLSNSIPTPHCTLTQNTGSPLMLRPHAGSDLDPVIPPLFVHSPG